jgi:light-harvesting complex II chlorophyll a/b binding protein 4
VHPLPPSSQPTPDRSKYDGDALWLPNTTRPEWLDGSLPGDRGFDPLGLSRPSDFVQIGVDENDQNAAKNSKGDVEGRAAAVADVVSETSLSPYSEVFGLQRFRETEIIHGRWAMLGVLGAVVAEGVTGESWWVARLPHAWLLCQRACMQLRRL